MQIFQKLKRVLLLDNFQNILALNTLHLYVSESENAVLFDNGVSQSLLNPVVQDANDKLPNL